MEISKSYPIYVYTLNDARSLRRESSIDIPPKRIGLWDTNLEKEILSYINVAPIASRIADIGPSECTFPDASGWLITIFPINYRYHNQRMDR